MLQLHNISELRKSAKGGIRAAAKGLNISRQRISRVERSESKATIEELESICNAYGCDIYILTRQEAGILQGIKAVIEQNSPKMAKNKGECSE